MNKLFLPLIKESLAINSIVHCSSLYVGTGSGCNKHCYILLISLVYYQSVEPTTNF